jgi:hypothetical protein
MGLVHRICNDVSPDPGILFLSTEQTTIGNAWNATFENQISKVLEFAIYLHTRKPGVERKGTRSKLHSVKLPGVDNFELH